MNVGPAPSGEAEARNELARLLESALLSADRLGLAVAAAHISQALETIRQDS
jgi:hypothetical protein